MNIFSNKKYVGLNKSGLKEGGHFIIPLIAIVILALTLIFVGGQYFAAQESGGRKAMDRPMKTMSRDIPRIDIETPAAIKTATFALG